MGSYYAGIMNATDIDKLEHFQVKGAKWGHRRWQNKDGSLTPAGRIHYGVGPARDSKVIEADNALRKEKKRLKERNRLVDDIKENRSTLVRESKAVDEIAKKMKNTVSEQRKASDKVSMYERAFYEDKETYEKYLDKAIDKQIEKYGGDRSDFDGYYRYEDWDQGEDSSIDLWSKSDDPRAKAYREALEEDRAAWKKGLEEAKNFAEEYLGDHAYDEVTRQLGSIKNTTTMRDALGSIAYNEAIIRSREEPWRGVPGLNWGTTRKYQHADGTLTEAGKKKLGISETYEGENENKGKRKYVYDGYDTSKPLEVINENGKKELPTGDDASSKIQKEYKRLRNLAGTKSLLGGDHTNDASAKVMRQYTDEIAKNQKSLDRSRTKEEYRDKNWKITEKYLDKYAEAVLEDMGYDTTEKNINWIKSQEWFGLPRAEFI